jgi:Fe-Mn family superoxide dismutase
MYETRDYSYLKGMPGFSDEALDIHFALYDGYVKNTNKELETLAKLEKNSTGFNEVKRRLGWEFDGMRLHEYYFENLGGNGEIDINGKLAKAMDREFGSFEEWKNDFIATGMMRGIGWAILYHDQRNGRLLNFWINEHDTGHPSGLVPVLIMDVFEHAFFPDYKLDRRAYIDAFLQNINWDVVVQRFS